MSERAEKPITMSVGNVDGLASVAVQVRTDGDRLTWSYRYGATDAESGTATSVDELFEEVAYSLAEFGFDTTHEDVEDAFKKAKP